MLKTMIVLLFISPATHGQVSRCVDIFSAKSPIPLFTQNLRSSLPDLILRGRDAVRYQHMSAADRFIFEQIISMSESQLKELVPRDQIEIFSLFARWNLILPVDFSRRLLASFSSNIDTWTGKNHLAFAMARKLTPSPIDRSFLFVLKKNILKKFSNWNLNTQMNVLGGELYQQTFFSFGEMSQLLNEVRDSLASSQDPQRLQSLKELYRGLLFLRSLEPTVFYLEIMRLEEELERHMKLFGLSLNSDGTSGAQNQAPKKSQTRIEFEIQLDRIFGTQGKIEEYSNPSRLGFYDPVDFFYAAQDLIVEWDGPHHYFRSLVLDVDGSILSFEGAVLRPLDQMKDKILRNQGYDILRVSKAMNDNLDKADIPLLIEIQNTQR